MVIADSKKAEDEIHLKKEDVFNLHNKNIKQQ